MRGGGMSEQSGRFYDFANFRLDISEKVLLRDGTPVPLTPKVFDTLKILIENAGRLLEKDELMREIWQDRFVEEGNLAFNIKVLRKAWRTVLTLGRTVLTLGRSAPAVRRGVRRGHFAGEMGRKCWIRKPFRKKNRQIEKKVRKISPIFGNT